MKKNKLSIEKFRIATFTNLSMIKGGTSINNDPIITNTNNSASTVTVPSADTTFTTDPNVACPEGQYSDTSHTSADGTGGGGSIIPTVNSTIPRIP